jgi:uncharacterized protein
VSFTPFFLPAPDGQRFCIHHPASGDARRGAVLHLHPFAEEMNKSRRMAALQARAMSAAGYDVLQIDLKGCGDSSGDFGDADWHDWIDDGLRAVAWLRERSDAPLWLWGLRTGGLLAAEVAARLNQPAGLLLWNPTASGKTFLKQFLRLRIAGEMLAGDERKAAQEIRDELAAGRPIEVAGYRLSAAMAAALENASLDARPPLRALRWMEVSSREEPALAPAALASVEKWRANCADVRTCAISGPAFWQTTEIEDAPALVDATLAEIGAKP